MVAPSGEQHEIVHGGYRAVLTECGASLRLLEHDADPLVLGWPEEAQTASGRGQLLAPWPNRIRGGRYSFGGRDQQLPLSEPGRGNASHGLVRWVAWRLLDRTGSSVRLGYRLMSQPGYPWTLDLTATYDLSADGLRVTVAADNRSDSPAPYALGAHPYLTCGPGPVDGWELTLPVRTRLLVDDAMIPSGQEDVRGTDLDFRVARVLGSVGLDTAFTDLLPTDDGRTTVQLRDPVAGRGVRLWMDDRHRWLQVFTGDALPANARRSLAVEPMTAPPDAFNSGQGVVVLSPAGSEGDRHVASWGIAAC